MKQRPWKRALSLVLAFALIFAMPCVTCVYADGVSVDYVERRWDSGRNVVDSQEKTADDCTQVNQNTTQWNNGWYVARGEIEISSRVEVEGNVNLILMDGCNLTITGGIHVAKDNSLTIYGQSAGTGQLTATAQQGTLNAGIGGNGSNDGGDRFAGTITIHGGQVTATGNIGAGIGGGAGGDGGKITIFGGKVTATGNSGGAGIGGGNGGDGGEITIYGGKITAKGTGNYGAGIGGGWCGTGGKITIYGGTVEATGGGGGAGIGGGEDSGYSSSTITISGGTVTATGGDSGGAGIGGGRGGYYGNGSTIIISGGEVEATGGASGGAGIGGGLDSTNNGTFSTTEGGTAVIFAAAGTEAAGNGNAIADQSGKANWSGIIFEKDGSATAYTGTVYGEQTLQNDLTLPKTSKDGEISISTTLNIPSGASLNVPKGKKLTLNNKSSLVVNEGGELTNEGELNVNGGALTNDGELNVNQNGTLIVNENGIVNNKGTLTNDGELNVNQNGKLNVNEGGTVDNKGALTNNGTLNVDKDGKLNVTENGTVNNNGTLTNAGALVVADGGTVQNNGTITSTGTVNGEINGNGTFKQSVTGVTLDQTELSLTAGEMKALTATVQPDNATNKSVTWSSSDSRVARVLADSSDSTKATVTAVGVGTATITVTAADGGEKATCTVTVTRKPASSSGGSGSPLPVADGSTPGTEPGGTFSQPEGCVSDTLGKVDVNGAYQFRLTSTNGTPPTVELDGEGFRAELASQEGNDYFWKVYAVGQTGQTCTVIVNGTAVAKLTAASVSGGVVSDTTAPFTVAAGGSYQFRLTADAKPTMAAGSPSFTVEYVGNEGKDWFFKVYAVGKPGDGCGFYVNGAPTPVAVAHVS